MQIIFADSVTDQTGALAFPVKKGDLPKQLPGLDDAAMALAQAAARTVRFEGAAGTLAEFIAGTPARRIILFGVGETVSGMGVEQAGGALVARLLVSGESSLTIDLTGSGIEGTDAARLALAADLRSWRIDQYRTKLPETQKPTLERVLIVGAGNAALDAWEDQAAIVAGVALTRTLVSEPPNIVYPETFVERCRHLEEHGVEITVLDRDAMEKLGMGALLGVSLGSAREPRLLAMRWDGTNGIQKRPLALVGKGVTFDTGGISLKPPPGMEDMKWDMGGAGAVAGAMKALALRNARAHVIGVCGLVENMPDGKAQRPSDIVTSMSGQTIEVLNTDAEGRLVLCDALTWVQKTHNPDTIIDLATLTGAMVIALGNEYGGLFTNDDGLADALIKAGSAVDEKLWRFPLSDAYNKLIDSPIADMKNVGPRNAGSITAAQFLQRYIEGDVKWAHLDIAGMVWSDKPASTWDKGATGYGVRLLDRYVADNCTLFCDA